MQVKKAIRYGVVVLLMTGLAPSSGHAEDPASVSLGHLWLTMREACRGVPDTNLQAHGVDRVDFHHDNPETRARVMERTEFLMAIGLRSPGFSMTAKSLPRPNEGRKEIFSRQSAACHLRQN